ncbi:MAG: hypothetical protein QM784_37095 [Polyangiaceae bacterium]
MSLFLTLCGMFLGCSDDGGPAVPGGTDNVGGTSELGSSTVTSGGLGGGGTTSGGTSTPTGTVPVGCEPWPIDKLLPFAGPSFYGPDPGPCSVTLTTLGAAADVYDYVYSDDDVLVRLVYHDTQLNYQSYTYDSLGRISTITTGADVTTLSYAPNAVTLTGPSEITRYQLDALGYPVSVTSTSILKKELTTSGTFTYDKCRLVSTTYTDGKGAPLPGEGSTTIAYDSEGHMVRRENVSSGRVATYDFGCW